MELNQTMPSIKKIIHIKAEPIKVFDLISRGEDYHKYSSLIKRIVATGHKTYHWVVNFYGFELEWDAKVVEWVMPERFAWTSTKGLRNSGSYTLEPTDDGTKVTFSMEYHFPSKIMDILAKIIAGGFMELIAGEILENVRKELEEPRG